MIQRLVTLLITLYISISLQAQDKKKPGFTKEEFRARQEAYLTQKAEITQEEATKFFKHAKAKILKQPMPNTNKL